MTISAMTSARLEQARREVGHTRVSRTAALAAAAVFVLSVGTVGLIDGAAGEGRWAWLGELAAGARTAASAAARLAPGEANLALQEAIDRAEEELEDSSLLRARLLPPAQWVLTRILGIGNEQAYLGRDGWLFYRSDVDHVVGRGFLEPAVQRARSRGGDPWESPPQPDPIAALEAFGEELGRRGIELLVLPTPLKPAVHPELFSARAAGAGPVLSNLSFPDFAERLGDLGIGLFDPSPLLESGRDGEELYLRTDTHWTPAAMDRVARALARRIEDILGGEPATRVDYLRRPVMVEGLGDVAVMLRLSAPEALYPAERVETQRVLTPDGRSWRAERDAEILLLGDSFTNIYSDAALGWGSGAGLAEQLSFHLRRPIDRIAMNAGGAYAARQTLSRPTGGGDRLAGKRLVVYQFAARELSSGDWKILPLPPAAGASPDPPADVSTE